MDKLIDLVFNATLRPHRYGAEYLAYEDGAQDFFRVLRKIEKLPAFDLGWSMADISLWEHESEFLVAAEKDNEAIGHSDEMGYIDINDDASRKLETERVFYSFDYSWGEYDTRLKGTLRRFHPKHDMSADICIGLIEAVTTWKRPQHISIRPTLYLTEHHPLDRMRLGIGWMGWVPFEITPSDVPEADLVRTMNGGSLIVSQMDFWQPYHEYPYYSKEAIERAQEVEVRLNLLGVLPTAIEIEKGDWGSKTAP